MIKSSSFILVIAFCLLQLDTSKAQSTAQKPVRMAVAGLTHGHAAFILDRAKKGKTDIELVGIYEPNKELAARLAKKYNLKD